MADALWRGSAPSSIATSSSTASRTRSSASCRPASSSREDARFWKPLVFTPEQRTRSYHWLGAVGRLKAGVSLEQARQEMRAVSASLAELQPPFKKTWSVAVDPFDQTLVGDSLRTSIYVAFGAVVMVLLIAAANIANLLLAKGVSAEQGDGRSGGARGQPRPARRADADREPGPLSPRRRGGRGARLPAHRGSGPAPGPVAAADRERRPRSPGAWFRRRRRRGRLPRRRPCCRPCRTRPAGCRRH